MHTQIVTKTRGERLPNRCKTWQKIGKKWHKNGIKMATKIDKCMLNEIVGAILIC